jgi:hypothetical protein
MLKNFSKGIFFILAYIPLLIFLEIRFASLDWLLVITILSIGLVLFLINRVIKNIVNIKSPPERIVMIETKNSEYLAFIITYLVPFFGFVPDLRSIIALLLFFIFLGFIYIRTSLFCINPLLNMIWGYNIYEIMIGKKKAFLLAKSSISQGTNMINLVPIIDEEVYLGELNED